MMGCILTDSAQGERVHSTEEMMLRFGSKLNANSEQWKQRLIDRPSELKLIEQEVHQLFANGADSFVAGLLAVVLSGEKIEEDAENTRQHFSRPLQKGRERTTSIRLLGGMIIWAVTLYCAPKKKCFGKDEGPRVGLDVTLSLFGFCKGVSPGLEDRVVRKVAICPSLAFATKELHREGVDLDARTVKRITYQAGQDMLKLRRHRIELLREGKLEPSPTLAGHRVSVQLDGGRMKIRGEMQEKRVKQEATDENGFPTGDAPGRSQKAPKRSYSTDWREPKQMTIFIHDADGKMVKQTKATIDGTLLGPDRLAEIVAMHLHRLGAALAQSITFVSDGAPWIWDRIDRIVELAGIGGVPIYQVLDCCHAVHHISQALAAAGLDKETRNPLYRQLRSELRNGRWRGVVEQLSAFQNPAGEEENKELETEISYLRRHGEAGRLRYVWFGRLGLPIGSGAIESSIRRVINLRLKSNAMFWKSDNAEVMLQVRSQVVPDQWDEMQSELLEFRRTQAYDNWKWEPQNMSSKIESSTKMAA